MAKIKTKPNGTAKKKHGKKDSKRISYLPNMKLGSFELKKRKRGLRCVKNNVILYEENGKYFKDSIKQIVDHPSIKLKKQNYLIKNVVVKSEKEKLIKIVDLNFVTGCIRGTLVN